MVGPHSWIHGHLRIRADVLGQVEQAAREGYARDEEACGYLRGPASEPLLCNEHVPMVNLANQLHRMDPEQYFRTGRSYFEFNGEKFRRAVNASELEGIPIKVLYHSHLDAGAYFSPTDAAAMSQGKMPESEGGAIEMGPGPPYPLAFLVTSVRAGNIDGHGLFIWDEQARAFVPSEFAVVQ